MARLRQPTSAAMRACDQPHTSSSLTFARRRALAHLISSAVHSVDLVFFQRPRPLAIQSIIASRWIWRRGMVPSGATLRTYDVTEDDILVEPIAATRTRTGADRAR
jgi:hypothetical protein